MIFAPAVCCNLYNLKVTTFLKGWCSGSESSNYRVLTVDHEKALVSGFAQHANML